MGECIKKRIKLLGIIGAMIAFALFWTALQFTPVFQDLNAQQDITYLTRTLPVLSSNSQFIGMQLPITNSLTYQMSEEHKESEVKKFDFSKKQTHNSLYKNGLVVVNTPRPIYFPEENITVIVAVLDKLGYPIDPKFKLYLKTPDGKRFPIPAKTLQRQRKGVYMGILEPESYLLSKQGEYMLVVQAKGKGINTGATKSFFVQETFPFDIVRNFPVSINPWDGPTFFDITVNDLIHVSKYVLKEKVPSSFSLLNISSNATLNNNTIFWNLTNESSVKYTAQSALISPDEQKFSASIQYVDPLTGEDKIFEEPRFWSLAVDALCFGDEYDFTSNSNAVSEVKTLKCQTPCTATSADTTATQDDVNGFGEMDDYDYETGGSIGKLKIKWKGLGDLSILRIDTGISQGLNILNDEIILRVVGSDFKEDKTQCSGKGEFITASDVDVYTYDSATTVDTASLTSFTTNFAYEEPLACTTSPTSCPVNALNLSVGSLYSYTPVGQNFILRLIVKETVGDNWEVSTISEAYVQYQIDYPANITTSVSVSNATLEAGMNNTFSATCAESNGQNFRFIVCKSGAAFCNSTTTGADLVCLDSFSTSASRSCQRTVNASDIGINSGGIGVCCDEGGFCDPVNETVANWTVLIAEAPQIISLNSPANGSTIDYTPIIFNYTPSDNFQLNNCSLWGGWNGWGLKDTHTSPINGSSNTFSFVSMPAGSFPWNVQCFDSLGQNGWYGTNYSITVLEIPQVTLLNPTDNYGSSATNFTFTYNISGTLPLTNCSLYIDSSLNQTNTSPVYNQTLSFSTNFSAQGSHNWYVECVNNQNSIGQSETRSISIDSEPPTSVVNDPSSGTAVQDSTPAINITLTDSIDSLLNYDVFADSVLNKQGTVTSGVKTQIVLLNLSSGSHTIIVEAEDDAGFKTNSSKLVLIIDTTKPKVSLIYPLNSDIIYDPTVIFNFKFIDTYSSSATCDININGVTNQTGLSLSNNTPLQWPVYNFVADTYTWNASCTDVAGNTNSSATNTFSVDLTPQGLGFGEDVPVPANGYSESVELFRMCTDAACSSAGTNFVASDTVYMQIKGPNDLGVLNKNKFYVYNGSSTSILRTGSWVCGGGGGSDATYDTCNVSFPLGNLADGWYFIESDIKDNGPGITHRHFTTFTIGSQPVSGLFYKFYNDASYTREDSTFFNGDEVYVEIFALPNLTMNTGKTSPTLTDFHKNKIKDFSGSETYDSTVSPYRFHFTMDNSATAGNWYVLEVKLEDASKVKIGPGKQGRMLLYESNYQPNISSVTIDPAPALEGQNVSFSITYSDQNIANRHILRVCPTNSLTGTSCTTTELCSNADYKLNNDLNNPRTCNYPVTRTTPENNTAYLFICDQKDSCTAGYNVSWDVQKDHILPTIALNTPLNNSWHNNASQIVSYTPSDGSNIANCSLYLDSLLNQSNTTIANGSINQFSLSNLQQGTHTWYVNCTDNSSSYNVNSSLTQTFYIDTTLPSVSISNPSNNTYTSNLTPSLNVTVSDNLDILLNYTIFVDGSINTFGTISNNTPIIISLNTLSEAAHIVLMQVQDEAGNVLNTTPLTITTDATIPKIIPTQPSSGIVTANETILFSYSVDDLLSPNATCQFFIDTILNRTDVPNVSTNVNFNITFLEGYHTWNISCNDTSGNTNQTLVYNITNDLSSPSIFLENPQNNTLNDTSNNIWFYFNVSDTTTNVENCSLIINNNVSTPISYDVTQNTLISLQRSLVNGQYNWSVSCTDTVDRTSTSEIRNLTLLVVTDFDAPVVTLSNPTNNSYLSNSSPVFYYTAVDALSNITNCSLFVNNIINVTDTNVSNGLQENFSLSGFIDGKYNWSVACVDTSINNNETGWSENRTFTIDTTVPTSFSLVAITNDTFTTNNSPIMNWTASNDTNFANYTIQFSDNASFTYYNNTYFVNNINTTFVATSGLSLDATLYWRVIAYDLANNNYSTASWIYTIDNTQPLEFNISSPSNNTYTTNRTPLLSWNQANDTNFVNYTVLVSINQNFSSINYQYVNSLQTDNTQQVVIPWTDNTNFYWKVVAYDKADNDRSSNVFSYTTDNIYPGTFSLLSPLNNTYSTSLTPLLSWDQSTETNFANYTIEVSTSSTFSFTNQTQINSLATDTNVTLSTLAQNTLYYWRVLANDKAGHETASSEIFKYTSDNTDPTVFLESPPNNTLYTQSLINFYYNVTDNFGLNNCSLIVNGTNKDSSSSITLNTTQELTTTLSNGDHEWFVKCYDFAGNFAESARRNISVSVIIPSTTLNETSVASYTDQTALINLGSKDGTQNQLDYVILQASLVTLVNATASSLGTNGFYMPSTASVSFSGEYEDSRNKGKSLVTWKLYKETGVGYELICKDGYDQSGGTSIPTALGTITGSCSPSTDFSLNSTDQFGLVINVYNSDTKTVTAFHYWDATGDSSFVTIEGYPLGLLDTNISDPLVDIQPSENTEFYLNCSTSCVGGYCFDTTIIVQYNTTSGWQDLASSGNLTLASGETNSKSLGEVDSSIQNTSFRILANTPSTHSVRCAATSTYSNVNGSITTSVSVRDITDPTITLGYPINDSWFNISNITYYYTASDNVALANCSLLVSGNITATAISPVSGSKTTNISAITTNGHHNWSMTCADTSNNTQTSTNKTIHIDTVVPSIAITSPSNNTFTQDTTPQIIFNATDNLDDSLSYEIFVDGSSNGQTDNTTQTLTTLDITTLSEGNHTLFVKVTDEAQNQNQSSTLTLFVDLTNPEISVTSPLDNMQTANDSVVFNYTFIDGLSPNGTCNLYVDGVLNDSSVLLNNTPYLPTVTFSEGVSLWNISCADLAGNSITTSAKNITVDLSSPVVNLEGPANNSYENNSNTVVFLFNTSDAITNVESCSFFLDSNLTGQNMSSPTENTLLNFTQVVENGNHNWYINCTDSIERIGQSQVFNITVNITIDNEPPSVILYSPVSNYYSNSSTTTFVYTPTDAISLIDYCSLYLNNLSNTTDTNVTNGEQNNFTLSSMQDANYTWYVNCTDSSPSSHSGISVTESFTLDTTLPTSFNISSPLNNTVSTSTNPTMNWQTTSDTNFLNYTLQFSTDSSFSTITSTYTSANITNTTVQATGLSANTVYYWRVIAYDKAGNKRISSQHDVYITDTLTPSSFTLLSPQNNSYSYNITPLMIWQQSTDSNFDNYTIQVTTDNLFATVDFEYTINTSAQTNISLSNSLTNNTVYYWRVIAYDKAGLNKTSTNYFIYNLDNDVPPVFDLLNPQNNSHSTDATPALSWQESFDLYFLNYTVVVSSDQNFSFNNYTYTTSPYTNTSYQLGSAWTDNTVFYWKVFTYDLAGNMRTSTSVNKYVIDNIDPILSIMGPANNYNSTDSVITFTYNVTDTNQINNCSLIIDGAIQHTSTSVTKDISQTIDESISNGVHTWSINCTDIAGNTINSSSRSLNQTVDIPLIRMNESSTLDYTSTASITLGARDILENKIIRTIGAKSLYTMDSALSDSVGGNGILIMPQTSLFFSGVFQATFANDGYITWKLYHNNGTDNVICQFGDDATTGEQITSTSKTTYNAQCVSPNNNVFIAPSDKVKFIVNIYNDRTSSQIFKHYWDGASDSFVDLYSYAIGNTSTNLTSPAQNFTINETKEFNVKCNVSCSFGSCINVKSYLQINGSSSWSDINQTGDIILNGTETNGKALGTVTSTQPKQTNFTVKANKISSNYLRCQARSDYVDNVNSTNISVTILDNSVPLLNLSFPSHNASTINTSINFSWTPTDNYYTNISCYVTVNNQSSDTITVNNNSLAVQEFQNLTPGFVYWNVTCYDGQNNLNTSVTRLLTILEAPTNLNITLSTDNTSLDLDWEPVQGAISYNVYMKANYSQNFSGTPDISNLTDTNWTDQNQNSSTEKYYLITAVRENAETQTVKILGKKAAQLQGGIWHLISFPFTITNNNLGNVSQLGDPISVSPPDGIKSIYRLNTSTQIWESVNYQNWGWEQSIGSDNFIQLDAGEGYWFEMNDNATIYYMGEVVEDVFNVSLNPGWNILGPVFNEVIILPNLSAEPPAYPFKVTPVNSITSLWYYDAVNETFKHTDHYDTSGFEGWWIATNELTQVMPNVGYYVEASQNATWEVGQ